MATSETAAGVDVVSQSPSKETEVRYRISVDDSGTRTTLASIVAKRATGATDGASLAISTDAVGGELAQRLVIGDQGNVGIGGDAPQARLHVAGDGRFDGPLSVQGAFTTGGAATIGGDLSVTGRLTAASFTGDGAGLSNVAPADNSITSAKLAQDAASLSKVTGGKMVLGPDRLDVAGYMALNGPLNVLGGFTAGSAAPNPISQIYGNLHVQGRLTAGVKAFRIDHPLDPENKYLSHSAVESPDVMNIYNGNITTDSEGHATVALPDYFEALNGDFRYQLTVIGEPALAAVEHEIENNRFTIKTERPYVKVSWQVTGIRRDASADLYRQPVEEEKPESERGSFLHPEAFGFSRAKALANTVHAMWDGRPIAPARR